MIGSVSGRRAIVKGAVDESGSVPIRKNTRRQMRTFLTSRGDAMKTTLSDEIIPAGGYWTSVVPDGQILRILDIEGNQGVDFLVLQR